MVAAAERLVARQQQELERVRRLAAEGALAAGAAAPLEEELERRRETLELARQRARLFEELAEMARAEEALAAQREEDEWPSSFEGGPAPESQLTAIERSFEREFGRPLPISARGETAVHRALGFDHRGRVDVALHPDQREGRWLLSLLERWQVPHFAFRSPVAGKSTGAHIHIGPPSGRFKASD
jgi:hypothetical protein